MSQRLFPRQLQLVRLQQVVSRDLDDLRADLRAKLLRENIANLYNMPIPSAVR